MLTSSSFFTGFGGADLGAQMSGLTTVCALEYDKDIAGVYEMNFGPHIRVMDFLELDLSTWPRTDHVHFSPPCPNFSVAKAGGVETAHDIALARKVAEAITTLLPRFVTIENVPAYKKSESFKLIVAALDSCGYYWDAPILNAADFGVPQTRKRMMLRAVRGGMLRQLPPPTPWRGWFAATEDLHAILPDSEFAPWQLKRLPEFLFDSTFFSNQVGTDGESGRRTELNRRDGANPVGTIAAHHRTVDGYRAVLVGGANTSDEQAAPGVGVSRADEPTLAVNTNPAWRAFLMPNANSTSHVISPDDEPMCAVGNTERVGNVPRAYIVHPSEQRDTPILPAESPLFTVITQENRGPFSPRAFLAQGGSAGRDLPTVFEDEPSFTIKAQEGVRQPSRAWLAHGRVVKMTPRALARFQGFPDSFRLPSKAVERKFRDDLGKAWRERMNHTELTDSQAAFLLEYLYSNDKLACRGIGNAVPPQFFAAQIKCLLGE